MINATRNLFILLLSSSTLAAFAAPSISQTKVQLQQLETKMNSLEQTLRVVHTKRETINLEIARTEKEIGETVRQLMTIQQNIAEKQQQIKVLKQLR